MIRVLLKHHQQGMTQPTQNQSSVESFCGEQLGAIFLLNLRPAGVKEAGQEAAQAKDPKNHLWQAR